MVSGVCGREGSPALEEAERLTGTESVAEQFSELGWSTSVWFFDPPSASVVAVVEHVVAGRV